MAELHLSTRQAACCRCSARHLRYNAGGWTLSLPKVVAPTCTTSPPSSPTLPTRLARKRPLGIKLLSIFVCCLRLFTPSTALTTRSTAISTSDVHIDYGSYMYVKALYGATVHFAIYCLQLIQSLLSFLSVVFINCKGHRSRNRWSTTLSTTVTFQILLSTSSSCLVGVHYLECGGHQLERSMIQLRTASV